MVQESLFDKVKRIVAYELGVEVSEVTPSASFIDDLGADSLDVVEIMMDVEQEFKIQISDAKAEKFLTVKDVVDCVHKYISQK